MDNFYKVHRDLLLNQELNATDKVVYISLNFLLRETTHPSLKDIARLAGITSRTVWISVNRLIKAGLIKKTQITNEMKVLENHYEIVKKIGV